MKVRFSISNIIMATALIAVGLGWYWDHNRSFNVRLQIASDALYSGEVIYTNNISNALASMRIDIISPERSKHDLLTFIDTMEGNTESNIVRLQKYQEVLDDLEKKK